MARDYIDSTGKLVRSYAPMPEVVVRSEADLATISAIYKPGTIAYTAGELSAWQLSAGRQWAAYAGRVREAGMVDYIDSTGKLIKTLSPTPSVMVRTEADLTMISAIYKPGTIAYTAGREQEWQLAPDGTWEPIATGDSEAAAAQASAAAQRAATAATQAAASTAGLAGWSLTKEADDTVTIDYTGS